MLTWQILGTRVTAALFVEVHKGHMDEPVAYTLSDADAVFIPCYACKSYWISDSVTRDGEVHVGS